MKVGADKILLMLAALGFALLLWFFVAAQERSEIVVSVPLEYRNIPRDYEISSRGDMVTKVNVWVRGYTASIKNLQPNDISVWIDLRKTRRGQESFDINTENVRVPYGFSVLRISPSQINLKIDKIVNRMVAVQPYFIGSPAPDYAVSQFSVTPPQVEVVGPESVVDTVHHAVTEPLDLTDKKGVYMFNARLAVNNSSLRLEGTREARVTVHIEEIQDVRTFGHVRLTLLNVKRGQVVRYTPKQVRIEIQAGKTLLEKLDADSVEADVDLDELKPGIYDLTPKIVFDSPDREKIGIKAVTPPRIHVRITQ